MKGNNENKNNDVNSADILEEMEDFYNNIVKKEESDKSNIHFIHLHNCIQSEFIARVEKIIEKNKLKEAKIKIDNYQIEQINDKEKQKMNYVITEYNKIMDES